MKQIINILPKVLELLEFNEVIRFQIFEWYYDSFQCLLHCWQKNEWKFIMQPNRHCFQIFGMNKWKYDLIFFFCQKEGLYYVRVFLTNTWLFCYLCQQDVK
jgi:hypothetical protein